MAEWAALDSLHYTNGLPKSSMAMGLPEAPLLPQYMMHSRQLPTSAVFSELEFSPSPPTKSLSANAVPEGSWTEGSLDQCIAYLNQEVTALGLPSLYDTSEGSLKFDVGRLVSATQRLLQRQQGSIRQREELENKLHRSSCDQSQLQQNHRRLQEKCEQLERDLALSQTQHLQMSKTNRKLTAKIKSHQEEEKRLQSALQHREAQYKHEVKKKERELVKLKDRLHLLLNDRGGVKGRAGIHISSSLQRASGKRGTWNTGGHHAKNEEDLYRSVLSGCEDKLRQVLVENTELRRSMAQMQQELVALLHSDQPDGNHQPPQVLEDAHSECSTADEEGNNFSPTQSQEISDGTFEMPFDLVSEDLHKSYTAKLRKLKQVIHQVDKCNGSGVHKKTSADKVSPHKDAIKLQKQVNRYKRIIEEQEKLIQQNIQSQHAAAEATILRLQEEIEDSDQSSHEDVELGQVLKSLNELDVSQNSATHSPITCRITSPNTKRLLPPVPSIPPKQHAPPPAKQPPEPVLIEREEDGDEDADFELQNDSLHDQEELPSARARPHSAGPTTAPFSCVSKSTHHPLSPGNVAFTQNPHGKTSVHRHSIDEHIEAIRASVVSLGEESCEPRGVHESNH